MSNVIKIALSGGPCSGKTTCLKAIWEHYSALGIPVYICHESATDVIFDGASRDDMLEFETRVAFHQLEIEGEILSSFCADKKAVVIFDRGLTDCFGYVDDEDALARNIGINRISSWERYDAVIFLGSSDEYQQSAVRTESREEAEQYASRVLNAWMGHPHLRFVGAYPTIEEKLEHIYGEIDCMVNSKELEKKYLVSYPDIDALQKYSPVMAEIEQVYLLSNIGSHRIRMRTVSGVTSYYETLKIRITGSLSEEEEFAISADDYIELLKNANPKKCPIVKKRYCFLYDGQYFELDVFPFWNDKAFLELELRNEDQAITLPPEINVIADVSEDKSYKNNSLASMLYKEKCKNENC